MVRSQVLLRKRNGNMTSRSAGYENEVSKFCTPKTATQPVEKDADAKGLVERKAGMLLLF